MQKDVRALSPAARTLGQGIHRDEISRHFPLIKGKQPTDDWEAVRRGKARLRGEKWLIF